MLQPSPIVVQPEQQRPDQLVPALGVPPEPRDHAVSASDVLHLHHRPLAGRVGAALRLGHDAVEPGALEAREPIGGKRGIAGHRREMHRWSDALEQRLQLAAALGLRLVPDVAAIDGKQVEGHEGGGDLARQLRHARRCRMQPHLQGIEVEPVRGGDDDLSIHHTPARQRRSERVVHLGEVAIERLEIAALDVHVRAVAEHDGAEPVPLRLVQERATGGQRLGDLGQHRLDRRGDGEGHLGFSGSQVLGVLEVLEVLSVHLCHLWRYLRYLWLRPSGSSFGGRLPRRAAAGSSGAYSSSTPLAALRSRSPPRLMSPRPMNDEG